MRAIFDIWDGTVPVIDALTGGGTLTRNPAANLLRRQ